jgi:hypothetical protein
MVSGAGGSGRNNVNVRLASTALHLLRHLPGAREAVFEYYAGGPQQVTEYVSRTVHKSRIPPAWCNNNASYVRLGGGHTAPWTS